MYFDTLTKVRFGRLFDIEIGHGNFISSDRYQNSFLFRQAAKLVESRLTLFER